MRNPLFAVTFLLLFAGSTWAQGQPVVTVTAEAKPNFVAIDQVVLNLNAVSSINYTATTGGGAMIAVSYLNGTTMTYSVKISADDWKKTQAEIVKAGNR